MSSKTFFSLLLGVGTLCAPNMSAAQQPPAPANIVAAETSPGVVTLTWSPVPGATQYFIGRSVWPDGFRRAAVVSDTIYVDSTVSGGKRIVYTVNALPGQRARSNEIIPGASGAVLADLPRRPGLDARTNPQPLTEASPEFVPPADLITPAPDTISAARCTAEANRQQQERRRTPRRVGRDSVAVTLPGEEQEAEKTSVERAYLDGKCRNPNSPGYKALWLPIAEKSGLSHDEQVRAWKELGLIALAYRHVLQREPTTEEIQRHVPALQRGKHWQELWRELAQSTERDERFGYWAPAPIASATAARRAFGLDFEPTPEMCYGGVGPGCSGSVPHASVEPKWFGRFSLPDGTEFAYVSVGVAVGSIVHDNACLVNRKGLNCDGLGAGDLWKTSDWPAAMEWNKATWNVLDGRVWRDVFGPYPVSRSLQVRFYDDLRPVRARKTYMAPVLSQASIPVLTVAYEGIETKRTAALKAPSGTSLDDRDMEYCASGQFSRRDSFPGKSSWGICQ